MVVVVEPFAAGEERQQPAVRRSVVVGAAAHRVPHRVHGAAQPEVADHVHDRGDALRDMNAAWSAGDRARALELVPDTLLDELIVHGSPAECARGVEEYVTAGVTTTAPMINAQGEQLREVLRALAPKVA